MATVLTCDMAPCSQAKDDQPALADWLVSRLDGTLNEAYCQADFEVLCLAVAQTVQERMAQGPELAAEGEQAEPDEPTDDDGELDQDVADRLEDEDAEAVARLNSRARELAMNPKGAGLTRTPANTAEASGPQDEGSAPPGAADAAPGPTTVVKRGTSRSRRAHQARKREREQATQEATE